MNTFLYVLVGWIIVLYLVNKVREKYSKPKTVKILVKRNGVYQDLAQGGHYNFAVTDLVRITRIMLNHLLW
ncbi:TPA: hypothetical protein OP732_004728 [Salmonella enterica]|nr:hypothetical protein [Salmonella enterica]HCS1167460.1 hypothetical protein [Salmonella enterica]